MRTKLTILFMLLIIMFSCTSDNNLSNNEQNSSNKVLLLKVDYLTHVFEGGIETTFDTFTPTFTVSTIFREPMDFGSITLKYRELNTTLFSGEIIWAGHGRILYPETMYASNYFDTVSTSDIVYPIGFENIFNPYNETYNYTPVWLAIQNLSKVREYLLLNPNARVKLFKYTPGVGTGNTAFNKWIIILKN